ncbi:glycoside hydrolase family 43 protein [Tengunoibacter tsumagoiensis]|uniref:Glycosyl hydrolase family 43 n=1 Tax=Tengunoibacter tsumagoiensis TaxID=2014871 RepID=A0A401ZUH2_9CHLR|nr:glycoside hydrolase family 43 protein [Tengunoibacter tsumagoiensis]GCE10523.1 glycosyl hydrolase family 43 [Tengunoibacter tsumagoiensis]
MFFPGEIWRDTAGQPIQAHGGGVLYAEGTYYWFGENKDKDTIYGRVDVVGVSCYSSQDLYHWQNEGVVLPAVLDDPKHDLYPRNVAERPKVIYNAHTKTYVMWLHVDSPDYLYARTGIAVSERPNGPYRYVGSIRPAGADSRDMTLFQDDDGSAYVISSSEMNRNLTIARLTPDYLQTTDQFIKALGKPDAHQGREAPAVFKHQGRYYLISSGCTGWDPNIAEWAVADTMLGEWKTMGDPCTGKDAEITYHAQSTFVLPVTGRPNAYIFMADRWNRHDLRDSRYVWLPLTFVDGAPQITWHDSWDLSVFSR